jgi:hypothetical protein
MSFFLSQDSRAGLSRVSCPVRAALARGKNPAVKIVEIDGLNHFFQTAITGSSMEVGQIEETFSPLALDLIVSWVQSHR